MARAMKLACESGRLAYLFRFAYPKDFTLKPAVGKKVLTSFTALYFLSNSKYFFGFTSNFSGEDFLNLYSSLTNYTMP